MRGSRNRRLALGSLAMAGALAAEPGVGASTSFILERSANRSTESGDVVLVDCEVGEVTQQIAFEPQSTAAWNLSSWSNVLTQMDNIIVNNKLEVENVEIDVRFNESASPSKLYDLDLRLP